MDIFAVGGFGIIDGAARRMVPRSLRNDATPQIMSLSPMSGRIPVVVGAVPGMQSPSLPVIDLVAGDRLRRVSVSV